VEIERESVTVGVDLPTLPNMVRMNAGDGTEGRSRLALWLVGIAATGFGIWVIFQLFSQAVGTHITDCGFDANGAYAEVRVNNLLGGAHNHEVWVDFYLDGRPYPYGGAYFRVPAHGHGKTVVRPGVTVFVDGTHQGQVKSVTRAFAEAHTLSCRFDYTDPD
jgi:hypothetical protein